MTLSPNGTPVLTPLQDALMDSLGARYRLGVDLWNFPKRASKALNALADYGLVRVMNGATGKDVRASLTDAGKAMVVLKSYTSPLEREVARLRSDTTRLLAERNDARDALIERHSAH